MLAIIVIVAVTADLFAFKARQTDEGTFFCQDYEGFCNSTIKYKIALPPHNGQILYCNNGLESAICNNELRVVEDNN